jgi:hypothetical protein
MYRKIRVQKLRKRSGRSCWKVWRAMSPSDAYHLVPALECLLSPDVRMVSGPLLEPFALIAGNLFPENLLTSPPNASETSSSLMQTSCNKDW